MGILSSMWPNPMLGCVVASTINIREMLIFLLSGTFFFGLSLYVPSIVNLWWSTLSLPKCDVSTATALPQFTLLALAHIHCLIARAFYQHSHVSCFDQSMQRLHLLRLRLALESQKSCIIMQMIVFLDERHGLRDSAIIIVVVLSTSVRASKLFFSTVRA